MYINRYGLLALVLFIQLNLLSYADTIEPQGSFQVEDSDKEELLADIDMYEEQGLSVGANDSNIPICVAPYKLYEPCYRISECFIFGINAKRPCKKYLRPTRIQSALLDPGSSSFIKPYTPSVPLQVLPPSLTGGSGQFLPDYRFIAESDAENGSEALRNWERAAQKRKPICFDGHCWIFRKTTKLNLSANVNGVISACPVVMTKAALLPFGKCAIVSAFTKKRNYVRALLGYSYVQYSAGRPDIVISLGDSWPDVSVLKKSIEDGLRSPPLRLEISNQPSIGPNFSIYGAAKFRRSPALPGWFEIITVHVQGGPPYPSDNRSEHGIVVSTSVYISKQATRRAQDYRLPEDAQQRAYNTMLIKELTRVLGVSTNRIKEVEY